MGQKVRPTGIRVGITRDWSSRWYANKKDFGRFLREDFLIRRHIKEHFYSAGVPRVEIERDGRRVTVKLWAARPGVVIGRKGSRVDQLRADLEEIAQQEVKLNIEEVQDIDTNAQCAGFGTQPKVIGRVCITGERCCQEENTGNFT